MAKAGPLNYHRPGFGEPAVGKQKIELAWRVSAQILGGLCAAMMLAGAAQAQVLEIQPDGTSVTYAGPVISTVEGIVPVAAPVRSKSSAMAAIRQAAVRHDVSPSLVEAVAWQESRLNQKAISPKGARGIMQLMPATARNLGVDADDLSGNLDGGAAYLAQMMQRFNGDLLRSLAAYNAGPEAVARYGGVPPYRETQNFVDAILNRLATSEVQP